MKAEKPIRIAMWSGPRNISTAMMRAWENRPDTVVIDEPFYAYFLERTKIDHPGRAEVLAVGETDWRKVAQRLTSEDLAPGKTVFYQKQMTHHLLAEIDRSFLRGLTNCFLIRHPAEVIASYLKKREEPTLEDLGFVQQAEIFESVRAEAIPPVMDARDVQENPERMLRLLCEAVRVDFDERMLSWPAGPRETDGVWAKYWYAEVEKSTCFQPPKPRTSEVPVGLRSIFEQCLALYERLREYRLH